MKWVDKDKWSKDYNSLQSAAMSGFVVKIFKTLCNLISLTNIRRHRHLNALTDLYHVFLI